MASFLDIRFKSHPGIIDKLALARSEVKEMALMSADAYPAIVEHSKSAAVVKAKAAKAGDEVPFAQWNAPKGVRLKRLLPR